MDSTLHNSSNVVFYNQTMIVLPRASLVVFDINANVMWSPKLPWQPTFDP